MYDPGSMASAVGAGWVKGTTHGIAVLQGGDHATYAIYGGKTRNPGTVYSCVMFSFRSIMTSRLSLLHSNLFGTFSKKEMPPRMTNPVIILVTAQTTISF